MVNRTFGCRARGALRLLAISLAAMTTVAISFQTAWAADSWKAEWQKTVALARKEGKVVVTAPAPGDIPRKAVLEFQKFYPHIGVDVVPWVGAEDAKLLAEQKAGVHALDVRLGGYTTLPGAPRELRDMGAYAPIRSLLILPEDRNAKAWRGGWDERFMDRDKKYVFAFQDEIVYQVYVNRDFVPESELSSPKQLSNPKWKGKISILDPRVGFLVATAAHLMLAYGEDYLRALYRNGVPVTQPRQQIEWLIRGQRPIAVAVHPLILVAFQKGGLGKHVEALGPDTLGGGRVSPGYGTVMVMAHAPHPDSAKVFLNWLLSRRGQMAWSKVVDKYMARVDVPAPKNATTSGRVDPNKKYLPSVHQEKYGKLQLKAEQLYKEIVLNK